MGGQGLTNCHVGRAWARRVRRRRCAHHRIAHVLAKRIVLEVEGMKCGGCVSAVQSALESVDDVTSASVNLATGTASLDVASEDALSLSIERASDKGYPARVRVHTLSTSKQTSSISSPSSSSARSKRTSQLAWAWLLSGSCMALHLTHHQSVHAMIPRFLHSPAVTCALTTAAFLGPGRDIFIQGLSAAKQKRPDMNTLVASGSGLAYGLSLLGWLNPALAVAEHDLFHEPAMLLGFVLLGRTLEENARENARNELKGLGELLPPEAQLVRYDEQKQSYVDDGRLPVDMVSVNQHVQVLPGEKIPVDGTIVEGEAEADESALTGEPMRIRKDPGDAVCAGTVLYGGRLVIRSDAVGADTKAIGVRALVEEAQARPANSQRVADRIAGQFSVGILASAAATFAFWSTLGLNLFPNAALMTGLNGSGPLAARLAADVTVVACPCALGLATPTAVLVGTSIGASLGVLIKGGDVLDTLAQIDYVCIDKTGTLTRGMPSVAASLPLQESYSSEGVISLAAALEQESSHPLAKAILESDEINRRHHENIDPELYDCVDNVRSLPGKGVYGFVKGIKTYVGSEAFVLEALGEQMHNMVKERIACSLSTEDSVVLVATEDEGIVGALAVRDELRPGAAEAVQRLQEQGLRVLVLSGDQQDVTQALSSRVDASERAVGSMAPEDKADVVRSLQDEQGYRVMTVGDGINDAPALAAASVGVAMRGGLGAAEEAASVVLMREELGAAADAIDIGRRTSSKIRSNLLWALGYNAVGVPVAAGALLPTFGYALDPSLAGLAMAMSSVTVVTSSLMMRAHWFGLRSVIPSFEGFKSFLDLPGSFESAQNRTERSGRLQQPSG